MKKLLSTFLALVLSVSLFSPALPCMTAYAASFVPSTVSPDGVILDPGSVALWDSLWPTISTKYGSLDTADYWWDVVDTAILNTCILGAVSSQSQLSKYASSLIGSGKGSLLYGLNNYTSLHTGNFRKISSLGWDFVVMFDPVYSVYRIFDATHNLWLVTSTGAFPYYSPDEVIENESIGGDHWAHISEVNKDQINILSVDSLRSLSANVARNVGPSPLQIHKMDSTFMGIYHYRSSDSLGIKGGDYYWVDANNHPYCSQISSDDWAVNAPQDYYTDAVEDSDGTYTVGDTVSDQLVDIIQNTLNDVATGNTYYIDGITYDSSNKTYNIDAHTEYNIENNYYYTYNFSYIYHINYTSVTYIGTTAEYNKTYEYYYQLPDGRSSADLTVEELQALNTNIDVLPYLRSADDTAIRALYHFDGDTNDSSYWSYAGEFIWDTGASITYMDAGAFEGALYLDENAHKFHIKLPSNLLRSDFTIQFRYYQSATITPVSDSSISLGSLTLCSLTGDAITFNGSSYPISVGNWQELCFMRSGNTLYCYHNGVVLGSMSVSGTYYDTLTFAFGSEQQTYKYFDELRVVSKALYSGSYTPTSVPYDTNLALVLPDSQLPVADSYWQFSSSKTNLLSTSHMDDFSNGSLDYLNYYKSFSGSPWIYDWANSWWWCTDSTVWNTLSYTNPWPHWFSFSEMSSITINDRSAAVSTSSWTVDGHTVDILEAPFNRNLSSNRNYPTFLLPTGGIRTMLGYSKYANSVDQTLPSGQYTFSMVDSDGNIGSVTFTMPTLSKTSNNGRVTPDYSTIDFNGYRIGVIRYHPSNYYNGSTVYDFIIYLVVQPLAVGSGGEFVYLELVEGDSTDLTAEYVESVVVMDKDDLNTPSLAVRTDLDITGYQIGGVRPSLPTKGLVWALVEDGMITSLQIYNGQAWESVDGRIWTGSRWVPYYAYDVILLKDLYDVVESDPSLDYIYTESGFWKWLQSAWANMMAKLDAIHITISGLGTASGGSGAGTINPDPDDPDFPDSENSSGEKWSIIQLFGGVVDGVWVITTGVVNTCVDGVSGLVDTVGSAGDFFSAYRVSDDPGNDLFGMFTYEGSDIWD